MRQWPPKYLAFGVIGAVFLASGPVAAQGEPGFERSPAAGPKGSQILLKGRCTDTTGARGDVVRMFLQHPAGGALAEAAFTVESDGAWSGSLRVPEADSQGRPVATGHYILRGDCEIEERFEDEFTYADQPFTICEPGPDCPSPAPGEGCVANCVGAPAARGLPQPSGQGQATRGGSPQDSEPVPDSKTQRRGWDRSFMQGPNAANIESARPAKDLASARIQSAQRAALEDKQDGVGRANRVAALVLATAAALLAGANLVLRRRSRRGNVPD